MNEHKENRVLRHSRREALLALVIWLAAMSFTVGYCARHAYGRDPSDLSFVMGFPDWVFWGIVVPWVACVVVSWWFAVFFMGDEPLDPECVAGEEVESLPEQGNE
jgi:hypothetical protein